MAKTKALFLLFIGCLPCLYCIPVDGGLVAVTEPSSSTSAATKEETTEVAGEPKITEMYIKSDVTNRFARTVVTSKVKNFGKTAKETTFFVVLPEDAYIAEFIMEIAGKNYTAYVEEKDKAKQTYDTAVASGQGAAHVAVNARDSNKFTVSMNIEPESKAIFYLTYEELLKRNDGKYELIVNINPKQIVNDMTVEVVIDESRKLTSVHTPQMRTGNEIIKESEDLDPRATITRPAENMAIIIFKPNPEKQKQIAHGLGKDEKEGINGQFVVVYDVERDATGGEVLVKNGYFVHFFAPADQQPLKKHVVFVLDTSGSMYGQKIVQLRASMFKILGDAQPLDFFNLVEFNTNVKVHNLDALSESTTFPEGSDNWYNSNQVFELTDVSFPPAYPVNEHTKTKANSAVEGMQAVGGTNIYEALRVGLHLLKLRAQRIQDEKVQPIIFFLTDGDPTVGITNQKEIISKISEQNTARVPIISLSFGTGADQSFLEKLSLNNFGFARHIYEDSDASLQLENFYKEVSSPLLRNIKFNYVDDATSLTKTEYPIYFKGSEFVVAGKIKDDAFYEIPRVDCIGIIGPIILNTTVTKSVGQLERLWAYLTVHKYLDAKKTDETKAKEYDQKAIELAKKYSFVTPVTSLVVVKPNSTSAVDTVKADGSNQGFYGNFGPQASFNAVGGFGSGGMAASYPAYSKVAAAPAAIPPQAPVPLASPYNIYGSGGFPMFHSAPTASHDLLSTRQYTAIPFRAPKYATHYLTLDFDQDSLPDQLFMRGVPFRSRLSSCVGLVVSGFAPPAFRPQLISAYTTTFVPPYATSGTHIAFDADAVEDDDYLPEAEIDIAPTSVAVTESTTTPVPVTLPDEYKPYLEWISAYLRPDGTLKFFKGNFNLGFNATSPDKQPCTSQDSKTGQCKLVKDCPKLHNSLKDELSFKNNFCSIDDKYAGVCCV